MMPGENQSKVGGIASDATSATCQNCTVLNQSLDEYVAALITLKQKIIDTDHLLSEYKEKCGELQKSQRESSKLHRQLDEVLLKLEPLEKQTAEYEYIKTELEKTKADLRSYQLECEDVEKLRADNSQALSLKEKVEESLRKAVDTVQRQNLENEMLRSQQKTLKENLLNTQDSLQKYQRIVEELDNLKLENAKTLILKENIENELLVLKESNVQQSNEIFNLKNEKDILEEILHTTKQRLNILEKEFNKEKRSTCSQTDAELHIDKGKVRKLLEELWQCVEPSSQPNDQFLLNRESTPLKNQLNHTAPQPVLTSPLETQEYYPSQGKQSPKTHLLSLKIMSSSSLKSSYQSLTKPSKQQHLSSPTKKRKVRSAVLEHVDCGTNKVDKSMKQENNNKHLFHEDNYTDFEDITELFRPLPKVISPLHSPLTEMVCPYDEQPVLDYVEEDQPEALSNLHILKNTTLLHSGFKSQTSDVETSSASLSPLTLLNTEPIDDLNLKNKSFDVKYSCLDDATNPTLLPFVETLKPSVENIHTVTTSLEDHKQLVEDDFVLNQNIVTTQSEATKVTNIPINLLETSNAQQHVEPDPTLTCSVESLENKHSQIQSFLSLKSNVNAVAITNVNNKLNDSETEELKSVPLKIRTVAEMSMHGIQNTLTNSLSNKDGSKLINDRKVLNERENCVSFFKFSKDKESSLSEDEGLFGLETNLSVRRVHLGPMIRIFSKELDDASESVQHSSANQFAKGEPFESIDQSYSTEYSTVNMNEHDERESELLETEDIVLPVCLNTTEDFQKEDNSENLKKTLLQNNEKFYQQNEIIDDLSSKCLHSNVYTNMETSGESAFVDCPESTRKLYHVAFLAGNCEKTENVSDLNRKVHITPTQSLSLVRTEMGPPLPPVVMPLTATPPRFGKHHTLSKCTSSSTRFPSDGPKSPKMTTSLSVIDPALKMSPCLITPSLSSGVPSSPLQFGSATPKHAVPVPGRLPSSAMSSSPPAASQENSMQMLDTMYPELSARARTLNILWGNVNLNRAGNENGASPTSVNQISGNKTISSSSTAFKPKRTGVNMLLPKSAKRLRLDNCSPAPSTASPAEQVMDYQTLKVDETDNTESHQLRQSNETNSKTGEKPDTKRDVKEFQILEALVKIENSSFEVLPVVKSHLFLGRISKQPILIDEEKAVIADYCINQASADTLMSAILTKLKTERSILNCANLQAYCRVYTGLCRQMGDYQKAHALAYSILKEDFPYASKLILFMVMTWPCMLFHETSLCRAIQTVAKLQAEGEILEYLTKYLNWEKTPPHDINDLISSTVKALREDKDLTFEKHHRHGHDLCPAAWEYIYTLDLLCTHVKWKWTHDVVIGKELWPIMNAWVTQQRPQQTPVRDVSVAAILRLIGRLGQLGIKQRLFKSVQNVARAINLFGKHGITEGVPDEVQLSAVYAIYDLAPCNPKDALEALASWRSETSQPVPSAVTSCIIQIGSLCRQIKS